MAAEVDAWLAKYESPQKALVQATREVILSGDPRLGETIKWSTPTFVYKGNLASFNPRAKAHVSLIFHTGASLRGEFPSLEGGLEVGRFMKVHSRADLDAKAAELRAIVKAWCDQQDETPAKRARGTGRKQA